MTPYPPPPNCAVAEDFGSQVAVRLNVTLSPTDQVAQRLLAISVTAVELYLIARKRAPEGSQTRSRFLRAVTACTSWEGAVGEAKWL